MSYLIGDRLTSKKAHPCNNNEWEIVRTGADYKIKCTKCGRIILVDQIKINKMQKKVS